MNKLLIATAIIGTFCFFNMKKVPPTTEEAPLKNYQTYCAGCHGEKVEMFVDRNWKYGNKKENLIASISNGKLEKGMPAWKEVLKPSEVEAISEMILNGIEEGKKYRFTDKPTSNIFQQDGMTLKLDTIASGLGNPWGIAFLPNDEVLVTDRNGDMYRIDSKRVKTKMAGVPKVHAEGQGGLLDVILHPKYAENNLIYISYSLPKKTDAGTEATTAIMRAKLVGNELIEQKNIFIAEPYFNTQYHYGSRMQFDKKGFLFFTVGERGKENVNPQDLGSDCGKVHRINDDGSVPKDNPYVKTKGARPTIYSWGHRNPQGLIINQETGVIWETEHGPRGGDELNIIKKTVNYGWPVISYGINYDGKPITNLTEKKGLEQPQHYWIPSIGPSGATFINSDKYKGWKGNLLMGSLRFKYLNRVVLENNKVVKEEILLKNIGRLRDVKMSPDGYIYVCVEEPGFVFKVVPVQ